MSVALDIDPLTMDDLPYFRQALRKLTTRPSPPGAHSAPGGTPQASQPAGETAWRPVLKAMAA
jgi:hypothetical protein